MAMAALFTTFNAPTPEPVAMVLKVLLDHKVLLDLLE
jgi:hypothetical protein